MSDWQKQKSLATSRRYFGVHYILLRLLGLGWWHHPDEGDTRNFPGLYIYYAIITGIGLVAVFVGLETIDPFMGEKDIDRFMFTIAFVITHDLTCIKMYIFYIKNNEIQDIVRTLVVDLQNFYQNNEKNRRTIRITRILTMTFVFFGWMTILFTNVYGIVQDVIWKAEIAKLNVTSLKPLRTLPQPIYIPWDYQGDVSYILTVLFETVGLLWTGDIVLTIDTFIGSIILQMSSQFDILQEALTTAYDRTIEQLIKRINRDSDDDDPLLIGDSHSTDVEHDHERIVRTYFTEQEVENALEKTLKSCFLQHQILTSCVEKFASTYSYGFMTQLISSTTAICVVMVQVSKDASSFKSMRLVTSLAFFACMIIQLAFQCFTGNELTYQASRVTEAVMACKWDRMPPRFRRLLVLMMMRAQRPLQLTAAGFANLDNSCFVAIMKAAYSYYAVLSQRQV